ncbi:MAG TPA: M48 family metallopeptidase [Paludibacter sp.]
MKKIASLVLLACILAACSSVMLTGRKQLLLVPDSDVVAMSLQSYKQFVDSVPPSTDKVNTALVKKVGAKMSAVVEAYMKANGYEADIANLAWEFNLLKDPQVNAFCMPGGKVAVFDGILPITKNETGLAVVMGHEIAHAIAKHSAERMSTQMIAQYGASLAGLLVSKKSEVTRAGVNTLYGLGTQYGVMLPYSRKHEYEADHMGLIFLAMAGYDPSKAVEFWERMAANSANNTAEIKSTQTSNASSIAKLNASSAAEFMSTHPSDANRIAKLNEMLPEAMKYYKK